MQTDNFLDFARNKSKKSKKEFISFQKRMGKNIIWFEALPIGKKWKLLFLWKEHKFIYHQKNRSISIRKFIGGKRKEKRFYVPIRYIRESAINKILNFDRKK